MSLDLGGSASLAQPIQGVEDLVRHLRGGEKPLSGWRVGVEHEKLGVTGDGGPVLYEGAAGIRATLTALASREHAQLHEESGKPIAVLGDDASVTLEPGGQLELSGAPFASLAPAAAEIDRHLAALRSISGPQGVRWLGGGYRPFGSRDAAPWMPKHRYGAMRASLGPRAPLALDMMLMTATVQANLDWSDEEDLAEKVRAATSVSPVVSALFANSPLRDGRPAGMLDFRYQVWRETDPARCGLLEQMVKPGWGYRSYVEWALDVPLLFVRKDGGYLHPGGQTFRQWMDKGVLVASGSERREAPTMSAWVDHLTTLFPEVRVKRVLELRGADMVPRPYLLGLPALWLGLLYDRDARAAAWELTARWTFVERLAFQADVARHALGARGPGGVRALDLAREVLAAARRGLGAWGARTGVDDRPFLEPLDALAASGVTLAEQALAAWDAGGPEALFRFWQIA